MDALKKKELRHPEKAKKKKFLLGRKNISIMHLGYINTRTAHTREGAI